MKPAQVETRARTLPSRSRATLRSPIVRDRRWATRRGGWFPKRVSGGGRSLRRQAEAMSPMPRRAGARAWSVSDRRDMPPGDDLLRRVCGRRVPGEDRVHERKLLQRSMRRVRASATTAGARGAHPLQPQSSEVRARRRSEMWSPRARRMSFSTKVPSRSSSPGSGKRKRIPMPAG